MQPHIPWLGFCLLCKKASVFQWCTPPAPEKSNTQKLKHTFQNTAMQGCLVQSTGHLILWGFQKEVQLSTEWGLLQVKWTNYEIFVSPFHECIFHLVNLHILHWFTSSQGKICNCTAIWWPRWAGGWFEAISNNLFDSLKRCEDACQFDIVFHPKYFIFFSPLFVQRQLFSWSIFVLSVLRKYRSLHLAPCFEWFACSHIRI